MFGNKSKELSIQVFENSLTHKERKRFSGKQNIDIKELISEVEQFFTNRKFGWLGEAKPVVQTRAESTAHQIQVFTSKGAIRTWGNSKNTSCNAIITVNETSLDVTVGYSGNKGVISAQGIGGALLTGGVSLVGNAASAAKDKKMVLDTMKFITELMNNYFVSTNNDQAAPQQQPDIFESIEKLKKLNDSGLITDEEFVSKKTELLNKL